SEVEDAATNCVRQNRGSSRKLQAVCLLLRPTLCRGPGVNAGDCGRLLWLLQCAEPSRARTAVLARKRRSSGTHPGSPAPGYSGQSRSITFDFDNDKCSRKGHDA
ncbi:unnamed protein product, partial [Amoebophrya sp. A120]